MPETIAEPGLRKPESKEGAAPNATNGAPPAQRIIQEVPIGEIIRSPFNREVDTKAPEFAELVDSIRIHGVIQPGLARPLPSALDPERKPGAPRLELVIGEHRWLGSKEAKRLTMPLIVRQLTDLEVVELQTIENDKRKDLSPIEEAEKYQQLLEQYEKTGATKEKAIAQLCEKLSKGKSTVYEALRLLQLPETVKAAVKSGKLPPSHAGLIAKIDNPSVQEKVLSLVAPANPEAPEVQKLERTHGIYCPDRNDKGLLPFRDVKEIVDEETAREKGRAKWEELAARTRAKGGVVLTEPEIEKAVSEYGKGRGEYLSGDDSTSDYSKSYSYQTYTALMGRHAPAPILAHDRSYSAVHLFLRKDAVAAIEKAGHKKISRADRSYASGPSAADQKKQAERKQLAARMKPVEDAGYKLLLKTAPKARQFPWSLFLTWFSEIGNYYPEKQLKEAGKSEKTAIAFLATSMVRDVENQGAWDEYRSEWQPQFAALCKHYGVDLAKLTKELAPPEPKKEPAKPKVQTTGKTKSTGLTPAARKKLSAAMKARWAARRKDAAKK